MYIATGTVELLRQQLSDNVGELSLARDRVTTLETLLDKATQRAVQEKENVVEVMDTLTEIRTKYTSEFKELNKLLKLILSGNKETMGQTRNASQSLTALVKTEVNAITRKMNNLEGSLKSIRKEMSQSEKRTRRAGVLGGLKIMDKVVNKTEALEKIFRLECEGIMKMLVFQNTHSTTVLSVTN